MSLDDLLRAYARKDLNRFCQGRNLTDTELAGPLLSAPGLSPRELVAATALDALASYEAMRKRTVEETTSSIGMDEDAPDDGLTFEQVRHLWARREVYRRAALEYAYTLGNARLIEHYQTPEPAPSEAAEPMDASNATSTSKGTPPKLTEADKVEILRRYNRGRGASVNAMAKQFNVSRPTIDKVLQHAGIKS